MTTANSRSASTGGYVAQPAFPNVCEGTLRHKSASPATRRPGNTYNVADMAPLLQAVRNAGANNVVILGAWRSQAR